MHYQAYPKAVDTPSRKSRKGQRNTVFTHNRKLRKLQRRPRSIVAPGAR